MLKGFLILMIFGTLLSRSFGAVRNYQVLRHDYEATAVKINTTAYESNVYRGTPVFDKFTLAFNANYYDPETREVIGLLADSSQWRHSMSRFTDVRPALLFDHKNRPLIKVNDWPYKSKYQTVLQAGPMLLSKGTCCIPESLKIGHYHPDTIAEGRPQISVGVTKDHKLIVLYSRRWSIWEISKYFIRQGCTEAMKMDGGHSASLTFHPDPDDRQSPEINIGNPTAVCGVYLNR